MHLYFPTKIDINGDVLPMIRRTQKATTVFPVEINETVANLLPGAALETISEGVYDDSTNWWVIADANLPRIHPASYKVGDTIQVPLISEVQNIDENNQRQRLFRAL